jgi:hypothetical protein
MTKKILIVLAFGFVVWAFYGALVGVGRQFMSMDKTLIVHAIGAPVGAAAASWLYFRKFDYTSPLTTAIIFVATSLMLDVFVVALLIEKSFGMFTSVIGVWIPQMLIFAATFLFWDAHLENGTKILQLPLPLIWRNAD